jgi:hypothetical protein
MVRYFSSDTCTCRLACWSDRIPFLVRKCQIDDDDPVNGEQQRLERRLHNGITCAHHECVGAERHAEQDSANGRPPAGKQAGHENRHKEQRVWSTCSVNGISHILRANTLATAAILKRYRNMVFLEQTVDATFHAIANLMRDAHRACSACSANVCQRRPLQLQLQRFTTLCFSFS